MKRFGVVMNRRTALKVAGISTLTTIGGLGLLRSILVEIGFDLVKETRTKMGTLVTISLVHKDIDIAKTIIEEAFLEIDRLEGLFSSYREGTPLWVLNSEGVLNDPSPEMLELLGYALEIDSLTDGAFDVTVASLSDLYSETFEEKGKSPSVLEIENALKLVGSKNIHVEPKQIIFRHEGMSISFDGIAKGYIVDQAAKIIRDAGVRGGLIDAGGDMVALGEDLLGQNWRLAIQHPRSTEDYLSVISVRNAAVATSGDYMQYLTEDLVLHHIIDPRLGTSPDHTSSVSVVAPTATDADALSTAALVMGPNEGIKLLNKLSDVEGILVTKDQQIIKTDGFSQYEVGV
tara:strand:- start:133937 stop:134974 length:1038 start_codon:yes stop_codon:yes gene_type:complete